MTSIEQITKAFTIGTRVHVIGSDISALVQAIIYTHEGCQYQVSYWHENIRRAEWVFPSEIEKEA